MALKDFKIQNLPLSQQLMLFGVVVGAILALSYMYLFQGMIEQRTALQNEIATLQAQNAETAAVMNELNRFKQESAKLEARLLELRAILPSQKEAPVLLRGVQEMAASSNLKIMKFTPQAIVPKGFYSDWPISMEVEGSYNGLGLFFERISDYTRIVNVDNLMVNGIPDSKDPQRTLKATCTTTTFVYREEPAPSSSTPGSGPAR